MIVVSGDNMMIIIIIILIKDIVDTHDLRLVEYKLLTRYFTHAILPQDLRSEELNAHHDYFTLVTYQ
jgi:hypothetical protein